MTDTWIEIIFMTTWLNAAIMNLIYWDFITNQNNDNEY